MRLHEDIGFTTLAWVKPELDETLRQARNALESYVENPGDSSQMRYCASYLHQVHGTLRMVELYGAAMVAEEMEQLAVALTQGVPEEPEEAYAVLMRGIVQLPDYLERLQGGHRDIPIVLLPLLNELREARGEKGLGESSLFSPDLGRALPASAAGPATPLADGELRAHADKLGTAYQTALLNWMRADSNEDHIAALTDVCDRLVKLVASEPARRLFWVAGGTLEALRAGAFEASTTLKQALARVEREIKRLADGGEAVFDASPPLELTRQLLYYVANAPTDYGRINEMRQVFSLHAYLPSAAELAHARGSMTGHNRALLDTVSVAIKDDLLRVKDALDLHLRAHDLPAGDLSEQVETLDRVADTLGMLGLGVPRRVVQEQRQAVLEVSTGVREADEGTLLDIAGALLYVEASLDDQVTQLGHVPESADADEDAGPLAAADARKVLEVVVKEAAANFAQARQCFVAFVETSWNPAQLEDVPRLLGEIGGALQMLEIERAPAYLLALRQFADEELLRRHRIPNAQQLETLADAMSSLEYFLEALRDQRGGREQILDTCERRLAALGYWPLGAPATFSVVETSRDRSRADAAEASTPPAADVAQGGVFDWPDEDADTDAGTAPEAPDAETTDAEAADADSGEQVFDSDEWMRAIASDGQGAFADSGPPEGDAPAALDQPAGEDDGSHFTIEFDESKAFAGVADPDLGIQVLGSSSDSAPRGPEQIVPAAEPTGFEGAGDEIDEEIREVFLEELQEEIAHLGELLPPWQARPEDLALLRPIRRVFHTLKGSGRLVGARSLGEFSWQVENALNRVLDASRPVSPAVVELVGYAHQVLPELHDSLAGTAGVRSDIAGLEAVAARIAAGEDAHFTPAAPAAADADAVQADPGPAGPPEDAADEEPTADRGDASAPAPEPAAAEPRLPVALDPVLFEILTTEVRGHLETVDAWTASESPPRATDPLLRAVHTMNGAFAMTDVPRVTELTAPLEAYIKRLLAADRPASPEAVALVRESAGSIRAILEALQEDDPGVPGLGDLPRRIAAERDRLPEPPAPTFYEEFGAEDAGAMVPEPVDLEPADVSALPGDAGDGTDAGDGPSSDAGADDGEFVWELEDLEDDLEASDAADTRTQGELATSEDFKRPSGTDEEPDFDMEELDATGLGTGTQSWTLADFDVSGPGTDDAADRLSAASDESDDLPDKDVRIRGLHDEDELPDPRRKGGEFSVAPDDAAPADPGIAGDAREPAAAGGESAADEAAGAGDAGAWSEGGTSTEAASVALQAQSDDGDEEGRLQAILRAKPDPDAAMDLADVDEELLDIFLDEARDLLDLSDERMSALRAAPGEPAPIAALQRDLHTLKGGARMAGVQALGELGHAMESLLEAVAQGRRELASPDIRLLEAGFDRLHRIVERVGLRRAVAMPERLIAAFLALAAGRPLPGFAEDPAATTASAADAGEGEGADAVIESQTQPSIDEEAAAGVEDAARTLPASDAQSSPQAPERDEPEAVEDHAPAPEVLDAGAWSSEDTGPAPADVVDEVEAAEPSIELQPQPVQALGPLSAPLEIEVLGDDEEGGIRSPQEQVRIRADLLDRLVNYAGEVAIYRARLEQQLGAFRGNLGELDTTTSRLREQLRNLEIETEAQIIARFQREPDAGDRDFDPLELDRFSTLQQLSRGLSESAADLVNLQGALEEHTRQYETLLTQQSRVSSDLQEGLMRTRMVPFDSLVPRLRRVLRQAGSDTGKQVQLAVEGAQGEMDRSVLERMTAPLEHMLRNAVAHGLETPEQRSEAGKPEEGTVQVAIAREGSEVVITVADDGRGLDLDAIRSRAVQRGLLAADAEVSREVLQAFILETGFSTAGEVSRLAGRGVGMDVVHNEIRQLGGVLGIDSEPGAGTRFQIRLPFTLAVTQAVFVRIGDIAFAVPIGSVQGVGRISREELEQQLESGKPAFRYGGEDYPIHDLGLLIGQPPARAGDSLQMPLLLARSGDLRAAICIDQVMGSREIVVKPVGPQLSSIPGIFGATVMGDGSVVIILDVAPLVRRKAMQPLQPPAGEPDSRPVPLVIVVDDSITMRKVTGRVLERHGMQVLTAKDGLDAIEKMADRVPDLMLLDVEMPRMDGYELATHMRNDTRLRDVPIIMVTSRTGEKHRQRAFEIGVDRYLGKPYQEAELMRNVHDLLGAERGDG